jgi:hypothetical protein
LTGRPVTWDPTMAQTYPGYTGALLPNPPPISGEMILILCSGRPRNSEYSVRCACGACEVDQTVSLPVTSSMSATAPHVSSGAGWTRG